MFDSKNRKENTVVLLQDKYFCFMHAIKMHALLEKVTRSKEKNKPCPFLHSLNLFFFNDLCATIFASKQ